MQSQIFQGFDALQPFVADSLSSYLMYSTKKEAKATFEGLRAYMEQ